MLVGYAHVSTIDQNPALQIRELKAAGRERMLTEQASGRQRGRPGLQSRSQRRAQLKCSPASTRSCEGRSLILHCWGLSKNPHVHQA